MKEEEGEDRTEEEGGGGMDEEGEGKRVEMGWDILDNSDKN